MSTRLCPKCKTSKPFSSFGKNRSTSTGLQSWCRACRSGEDRRSANLRYRGTHRAELNERSKLYRQENREAMSAYHVAYQKKRAKEDLQYRLRGNLRARLRAAVRQGNKGGSAIRDLGCSIPELINHLESQFLPEMHWSNYGKVWEIDHIIPLASWDLTDPDQCSGACRYTNLRPLPVGENRGRGSEQ